MLVGLLLLLNFSVVWLWSLMLQGFLFHQTPLGAVCRIVFAHADSSLRPVLGTVYRSPRHEEYALSAALVAVSIVLNTLCYLRGLTGEVLFILAWTGLGGRCMGGAYTFAHKEAHNSRLYRFRVNVFENWLGLLYGNVPYNFTTSHIHIHHALDGAKGDTFYMWDLPRNCPFAFAEYVERVFLHMCAVSPLRYFRGRDMHSQYKRLRHGAVCYWLVFPMCIFYISRSARVLFFIWLQPLLAMTVFLALINWAQHGFIELDNKGVHDPRVNATTIVNGRDDYFRENYHWEHHYTHDKPVDAGSKRKPATVFRDISIPELAVLMVFDRFEMLMKHTDLSASVMRRRASAIERQDAPNNARWAQ